MKLKMFALYNILTSSCNDCIKSIKSKNGGARGVIVIVVGNGHGDTSSNPGRD